MNKKNNNKVLWGVALITVATMMFLSAFNLLPEGFISLGISYALIFYGLYNLIKRQFYMGLFSLAFALKISPSILLPSLDFNQIGWFMLIFTTALFATGLETLFGKRYTWRKKFKNGKVSGFEFSNKTNNEDYTEDLFKEYIMVNLNMGATSRYIDSKYLKQADLNCNLGDLSVYFLNEHLQNDLNINVDCKLGNVNLHLPHNWKVVNNINSNLGAVDMRENLGSSEYTVYLNGSVSLGNLDIYFN